jgi:HlyD family type I secretion membrane fusion protein
MNELIASAPRRLALKERDFAVPLLRLLSRSRLGLSTVRDDPADAILAGFVVIILFFGVLVSWAAFAHISSAVIAPGRVTVEGNLQSVQHHFGGTIRRILVKDGDRVKKGQVLLTLDDTAARAKLNSLTAVRVSLKALEARLIAERDGAAEPRFDISLTSRIHEGDFSTSMANQLSLFRTRAQQFASEIAILRQRVAQLRQQADGARVQAQSAERQGVLIMEELEGVRSLYAKGYAPKTRLLALKRVAEELAATGGAKRAEMAKAEQAIGETELEMQRLGQKRLNEINEGLRDTQSKLAEIEPQITEAREVLKRTELLAPAAGIVVGMTVFTEGGVIAPGARVLDIVPSSGVLIVEARVPPEYVQDVREAAAARIRLTGTLGRWTPSLEGTVINLSADRLEDGRTGSPYYAAQIRIDTLSLPKSGVSLQAGMPAEVIIATKERSVLNYLLSPLSDQIALSFREE